MAGKDTMKILNPLSRPDTLRRCAIDSRQADDCFREEPGHQLTRHVINCRRQHYKKSLDTRNKKSSESSTYCSKNVDHNIAMREDRNAFHNIWFRPRVLVDVEEVHTSTTMLGTRVDMPCYVMTPSGLLGDANNKTILCKGTKKHNVIQMASTFIPCFSKIPDIAKGGEMQWLHLHANEDRETTERIVQHAEKRGCKAFVVTVDTVQMEYREERAWSECSGTCPDVQHTSEQEADQDQITTRPSSSFVNMRLCWEDISWLLSLTKMPLVLRGLRCTEDIMRAVESGIHGIILSSYSGSQPNLARSGIEILAEVMPLLRERKWQHKIEIYIESNALRGADIIKALCLGARGVGISQPFQGVMSVYGLPGVDRTINVLKDEIETTMRLIGASKVSDLSPTFVSVRSLGRPASPVPEDVLRGSVLDSFAKSTKAKL